MKVKFNRQNGKYEVRDDSYEIAGQVIFVPVSDKFGVNRGGNWQVTSTGEMFGTIDEAVAAVENS